MRAFDSGLRRLELRAEESVMDSGGGGERRR